MNRKQLLKEADQLEANTKANLAAWIICGETHKYEQRMEEVSNLRRAAELKGYARREFMQNKGLT